jgi:hypothetical protein
MFGIFHSDLPIGRTLWLVALTLVATRMWSGLPPAPSDSTSLALSLIVYAGHSIVFGALYNLFPTLAIYLADTWLLVRRGENWDERALLLEDHKYTNVREALVGICIVVAAAVAAPHFGDSSLNTSGLFGIALMILFELFGKYSEEQRPYLELRGTDNRSTAKLFVSGQLFAQIRLPEDVASALVHLRAAGWELDTPLAATARQAVWLRKEITPARLRLIRAIVDRELTREGAADELKYLLGLIAIGLGVSGWLTTLAAGGYILYITQHYRPASLANVLRSWAQGGGAGAIMLIGGILFYISLLIMRWLSGVSLLTGHPKKGASRRVAASQP